jgi:Lrp/AsnC family leucine-responsive transcriptional regulator
MNSIKIDPISEGILKIIRKNSSFTHREIARMIGTSAPTVSRRMKWLRDVGVIEKEIVLISAERLAHFKNDIQR